MRSQPVVAALALALVVCALPGDTDARPRPVRKATKNFEANKTFGLGLMLGFPTGLSGKYYVGTDTALDFGVGTGYNSRRDYDNGLSIHGDFLWHPLVIADPEPFWLPLYVGVGARFLEHGQRDDTHLGIRFPVGISMDFNNVPLDVFFELAFVIDFVHDEERHNRFDLHSAVGIRYYFN